MKSCPKCGSVVNSETECTVCGATITYEPYIDAENEHISRRMWLKYWLPRLALPFAATVIFVIGFAIRQEIDKYTLMAAFCLAAGWLTSLFKPRFIHGMQWKYNEDYAHFHANLAAILLPLISILITFSQLILQK